MTDFFADYVVTPLFALLVIFAIISIPFSVQDRVTGYHELQTILKNECGILDYSIDEIRRNGENLSLICGLKRATDVSNLEKHD